MRRQRFNLDPDLGDLEQMLANVQNQIEQEIDQENELKMTSLINIKESPPQIKRSASFTKDQNYRKQAPKPPIARVNSEVHNYQYRHKERDLRRIHSEVNSGSYSLNGDYSVPSEQTESTSIYGYGSQSNLSEKRSAGDMGSQSSFQSFRSEPFQRISGLNLHDNRGSIASLNGRSKNSKTATLPRGYGSSKEKNWEEYWAQ